ncbi:immune inhibitor A [bacterium]|nr:immune inhibitor A [bacterium]
MRGNFFIIAVLTSFLCVILYGQPLLRIDYDEFASNIQLNLDVAYVRPGAYADVVGWQDDIRKLEEANVEYRIIIPDLPQYYASRLDKNLSMGGYRTYSEILASLDSLHDLYEDIVSARDSIGAGWDGNVEYVIKISDNVNVDEDEPEVLYDAAIHAREVIVPEVLLYYMHWLCENYGTNPVATYLVNHREMWFITNVNPDGYIRNEIDHPEGGGMWRKNTRDNNENGIFETSYDGVDMNRNYDFHWGETGSSSYPGDETYRGPDAFSEPEIQGYRDFVLSRNFSTNITYHSYSGMYLFPWGYTSEHCADHDYYMLITDWMSIHNHYVHGNASETIYTVSGATIDWMYGTQDIISISPEVGGAEDGFWPPTDRIIPLCESQLLANIIIALIAGATPHIIDVGITENDGDGDGFSDIGEQINVDAYVKNYGLLDAEDVSATIRPISDGIIVVDSTSDISGTIAAKGGTAIASRMTISLAPPLQPGQQAKIELITTMPDGYYWADTFSFIVGTPHIISQCTFDAGYSSWSLSGDWEVGTPSERPTPFSAPNVLATRLASEYSDEMLSIATSPIYYIPTDEFSPKLSFENWYNIEGSEGEYYDGGNVQIRILPDTNWAVITPEGGYPATIISSNPYLPGQPGFSGSAMNWQQTMFDLSPYAGDSVQFRLVFGTDEYVHYEGWFIDDWEIISFEPETSAVIVLDGKDIPRKMEFAKPNPFNSSCAIFIPDAEKISIYNIAGEIVNTLETSHGFARWNGRDKNSKPCPSGIYFAKANKNGNALRLLLIK